MNMRFYTNEQVHQIVDQLLLQFDEAAPGPEPAHLNNDIPQQSSPENKVTLTVSEAAELIGISKPSMYEVVRTGKVRSVKVGKKILISRQSLMDWLKKGENYGAEACSRRRKSEKKKQWHLGGPGHPGHRFQDGQADQQERLRPHSEGVLGEDESAAGHRRRAGGYPTCRSQGATQAPAGGCHHRGAMAGHLAEGVPGRCKAQYGAPVRIRGAAASEAFLRRRTAQGSADTHDPEILQQDAGRWSEPQVHQEHPRHPAPGAGHGHAGGVSDEEPVHLHHPSQGGGEAGGAPGRT